MQRTQARRGGGCPFPRRTFAARHGIVALTPIFGHAHLHAGAAVRFDVTATSPQEDILVLNDEAIAMRDYPVIQAVILAFAASFVVINLLVDVSYGLLDPNPRIFANESRLDDARIAGTAAVIGFALIALAIFVGR